MKKAHVDNMGIPPLAGICSYDEAFKPGYSVGQSVDLLKRFNYVEKELNRMLSAHLARTPEWEVKCAIGYHLWLDAEHSAGIRKRISEMREPPLHLDKIPDKRLHAWLDEAIRADDTTELLVGIYRVVKPELIRAIRKYVSEMNPIADQPTHRLLRMILQEEEEMVSWGERALAAVLANGNRQEAADRWEAHLRAFLQAAGGLCGDLEPQPHSAPPRSDGRKYVMDAVPQRDRRFTQLYNRSGVVDEYYKDESRAYEERAYALIYKRLREMDVPEWMGPILYQTENKPWEYYADLSRQLWDEVRHAMLGEIGLCRGGVPFYKYPVDLKSSMVLNTEFDPIDAHLILWYIEQGLMPKKTGKQWEWEIAKESGNPISLLIQDFDWADEVLHAQIGRKWLVPHYGSLEAATAAGAQMMTAFRQAQIKMLEWSDQTPWWPDFIAEIRENAVASIAVGGDRQPRS